MAPRGDDGGGVGATARRRRGLLRRVWRTNRGRLLASAGALLGCALLLPPGREPVQAALAVCANLVACYGFAVTLLPGREPLISRYTRFDFGHLPPDCAGYTRALTALWAALLSAFAAAQAASLSGLWRPTDVLAAEAALCVAVFVGEHAVRGLRFPHHGPATLRRTLRAVRLAHHSHHHAERGDAPAG